MSSYKNFKSLQKGINNVKDIEDISCDILKFQDYLIKNIPKEEKTKWTDEEIETMKINVEKIDKLLHVSCIMISTGFIDHLVARQIVDNVPIYFELSAFTNSDNSFHSGEILYAKEPETFVNACQVNNQYKKIFRNYLAS